ncbi:tetratricopeptide repeat protein [Flavobacterium okayamense]|uniref:Tetratricopeptide repeat-containing protein n=1 Tax=Flavobacterium okayamense TaxID=2830782 RepID=A0ABM7S7P2_9FLAO|nr:hypothetical protein [Flavobacterium okayamense]BCY28953.1 hypothetical protein KK2020170_18210 [Flavobacterium okayamense]
MNELIEKYFENNLTPEEQLLFDEKLNQDAEFKAEFEFHLELKNAIKLAERQKIKKEIQKFEIEAKTPVFYLKSYFKYAAIFLVMFSLWFVMFNNTNNNELYNSYFDPYPNTVISNTRSDVNEKTIIEEAFIAYDLGEYNKANDLFENALKVTKTDYILFYKAICLMELNKHKDAIKLFESTNLSNEYLEKSLWFEALCYLKLNNKSVARQKLETLVKKKSFKNTEAEELLSKL